MANNKLFIVLLGLTLVLATQAAWAPNMCPVWNPSMPVPACAANIVPGCAGYKDGTFKYVSNGNRCTYCYGGDSNVVSFNENQRCPDLVATPTPTPTPSGFTANKCPVWNPSLPTPACAANVVPGCAGYKNGTYKYLTNGNRCIHCYGGLDKNIVSFNENQRCPALSTPTPNPSGFTANKCPVWNPSMPVPACAANIVPGCAGYKNGTYKYVSNGNRCTYCYGGDSNVVSFNENQRCPVLSTPTPTPTPSGFTANKCPVWNPSLPTPACAANVVPGCAGYKNGTYKYLTNGNRCTFCYGADKNIVSFNENQQCPTLSSGNNGSNGSKKLSTKFGFRAGVLHY